MRKIPLVLLVALTAAACTPTIVVPSPSPSATASPTPSPTASPSPSPSPSPSASPSPRPTPTHTRTPRPQPTGTTAGDRILPFYFQIRQTLYPLLPPTPQILLDSAADTDLNARFMALNAQGQPMFTVREDFVMDYGTAAHEIGHAYQALLEHAYPGVDFLAKYWAFRGFPGTWQSARAQSQAQSSTLAAWTLNPVESWAEAFRASVTLEVKERTLDYGHTIDPSATRTFFQGLAAGG